jgi:hypothetical protein
MFYYNKNSNKMQEKTKPKFPIPKIILTNQNQDLFFKGIKLIETETESLIYTIADHTFLKWHSLFTALPKPPIHNLYPIKKFITSAPHDIKLITGNLNLSLTIKLYKFFYKPHFNTPYDSTIIDTLKWKS